MQYLVNGKEMKLLDQNTSNHFHVPELVLMEQAAMAFVQRLFLLTEERKKVFEHVLIVCGSGNNGADGLAIARLLTQRGVKVMIVTAGEAAGLKTSDSYDTQKDICKAYGIPMTGGLPERMQEYDLIIDAVFGTGLSRKVEGPLAHVLGQLNESTGWKVAVDIASGLSSDNGECMGCAFCAEDTITFSFGKLGQFLWPGNEYSGNVHVAPIGITEQSFLTHKPKVAVLEQKDLALLPKRKPHSNKGTYGKLLVVAGSVDMAGAACLCARAAYRMGTGLVRILTPQENRTIIQTCVPEAILTTYDDRNLDSSAVAEAVNWADAVVLGPGIGTGETAQRLFDAVMNCVSVPIVLDADALNILAMNPQRLLGPHTGVILTPHLGEMSRLVNETVTFLQRSLMEASVEFAGTYDVICVLKDFRTVTALPYGMKYLNLSGNHGMATAGSGDVLAGVIGGLLAQGIPADMAAPYGVFIHGAAGDAAAARTGKRALMAGDIVDGLQEINLGE